MKSILRIATLSSIGIITAIGFLRSEPYSFRGKWVTPLTTIDTTAKPKRGLAKITKINPTTLQSALRSGVKDSTKLVFLLDTSGAFINQAECDAYGNVRFFIAQPGVYRIAQMSGTTVVHSQRTLLNSGLQLLRIPLINPSYATNSGLGESTYSRHTKRLAPMADGISMSLKHESSVGISSTSEEASDDVPVREFEDVTEMATPLSGVRAVAPGRSMTPPRSGVRADGLSTSKTKERIGAVIPDKEATEKAKAGVVTAGIWNDLENWERFNTTWKEPETSVAFWKWNLNNRRYAIEISDKDSKPAIDINVQLRNADGTVLWSAKTDNRGFADLWNAPFLANTKPETGSLWLFAQYGERPYTQLGKVSANGESRNSFRLDYLQETPKNVDVCFVVDATGSMGDEINYLKEELMELMMRSSEMTPCSDLRLSSVFYRDLDDDYTAIHAPFTARFEDAVGFVQSQSAGGGGDFPEAVDAGLDEALGKLEWSPKALARLCFLVLDAPPHEEKQAEIQRLTAAYAAKGIKIIPIAASGVDKPTEFLMKQMAALTEGEYIYITDHSGVGNSHIKPTGGESSVDLLKNQLEKVIRKYTENKDCSDSVKPYEPDPQTLIFGDDQIIIQSFPNPAYSFIDIHSNVTIQSVSVYALNGQLVKNIETVGDKRYRLDVRDIDKGLYILSVKTSGQVYTSKILILDSQRLD